MAEKRQTNIELLRVISMWLIVISHYMFHGLKSNPNISTFDVFHSRIDAFNYWSAEPLWILSCTAVNCYVMITGYFLIEKKDFRWNGILRTWIQTWFYSICFLIVIVLGNYDYTVHDILKSLMPVHENGYWFVKTYLGLLFVAPFLSRLALALNKRQYQILIFVLFVLTFQYLYGMVYAGFNTIIWFSFLFLLSGYLKIHGIPNLILKNRKTIFFSIWILLIAMATSANFVRKGNFQLISSAYDGPVFFLSLSIFILFINLKPSWKLIGTIEKLAPYVFGVYLIHDNIFVREHIWNICIPEEYKIPIVFHCIGVSLAIFFCCIFIDYIRSILFKIVRLEVCFKWLCDKLPKLQK